MTIVRTHWRLLIGALATLGVFAVLPATGRGSADETLMVTRVAGGYTRLRARPAVVEASRTIGTPSQVDVWRVRRWTRWGRASAAGQATYIWRTPDGSGRRGYPAAITADRRFAGCVEGAYFRRVRGRFTARIPPGLPRVVVVSVNYHCGE